MANSSYVESFFGGLDAPIRRALKQTFDYVLKDIRLGRAQGAAQNFPGVFITGTTDAVANTEFTIAHGLGRTPYLAFPVLALDAIGAGTPRLQVSRAADASRIYLKSPDTAVAVTLYVEG